VARDCLRPRRYFPDPNAKRRQRRNSPAQGRTTRKASETMCTADEAPLIELHITDRNDPLTESIAAAIVSVTATGERGPIHIKERALHAITFPRTGTAESLSNTLPSR
jgi:hypothetical protein